MAVGEISKDNISFPMDNTIGEVLAKEGIITPLAKGTSQVDTLGQAITDDTMGPKNIPTSPDQPVIDDPRMELVLLKGQEVEEAFKQNPLFATQARMNDFFILQSTIMKLLSENRMRDDESRRGTRQKKFDVGMETAVVRKQTKLNEAAQELTKGIGSVVQAGISGVEAINVQKNSLRAENQLTEELNTKKQTAADYKTSGLDKIKEQVANLPPKDQDQVLISSDRDAITAREADRKTAMDAVTPEQIKSHADYPAYKQELRKLENIANSAEEQFSSNQLQRMTNLDNTTKALSQTAQSISNGIVQMSVAGLQIQAGDLQLTEGENNANLEMMRSFEEGQSKAVDQSREAINELVRSFVQLSEKYIQSLQGRA